MSETKLLPCPFCGERPSETGNNLIGIVIACRTPNCAPEPLVSARNRAEAYGAWNTRPVTPDLIERVLKYVGEEQLRNLPRARVR